MAVASFETLDIRETKSAPLGPEQGIVVFDLGTQVSEIDLFALLLWHLRRPQGMFTVLGRSMHGDPDGPFKWDFSFQLPDGSYLWFVRTWLTLEARSLGRETSAREIVAFVRHNLTLHSEAVAATRETLERHVLVVNPYVRHLTMADHAEEMLGAISVPPIWYPPSMVTTGPNIERHHESITAHTTEARRETFYSVSLVTEAAYAAEAFLNLLLAFTLRPEIRGNRTIFEETLRRPWKTKIQYLPLTSVVVRATPDLGDSRVRDADRLFALRNRIAHSYPDPDHLAVGHVHFFENFPVLENGGPYDGFQLTTQRLLPTRKEAMAGKRAAHRLVEYLSELIIPEARENLLVGCNATPLGWREDKQSFSVPFGVGLVHALFASPDEQG